MAENPRVKMGSFWERTPIHLKTAKELVRKTKHGGTSTTTLVKLATSEQPEVTPGNVQELLSYWRRANVLDYRNGRWYYVHSRDRKAFLTRVTKQVLAQVPYAPSYTTLTRLKRATNMQVTEIRDIITTLHKRGLIRVSLMSVRMQGMIKQRKYFMIYRTLKNHEMLIRKALRYYATCNRPAARVKSGKITQGQPRSKGEARTGSVRQEERTKRTQAKM